MAPTLARARKLLFGTDLAAVLAVGVVYVTTTARHLLGGDAGELAAVAASGGVAHPPGYPLFVLVERAFGWLPAASPAHRAGLVTALVATLSVAALAWAARAWGASRASATFAALLYAFGPLAWDLATHPEVFALNVLLAMGIVGLSADAPPRGSEMLRAILLALLAGLGLSNHHSILLLAPIGLFAFGRAVIRSGARTRTLGLSLVALVVGIAPYAYLLLAAREPNACVWGDPRTLGGLLDHFLRKEYGTTQLGISEAAPEPLAHVVSLFEQLVTDLPGSLVILAVGGVVALRMRGPSTRFVPHLLLVVTLLLAGPVFAARFNLPAHGLAQIVTERFHLLPLALDAVLLALAIDACIRAHRAERSGISSCVVRAAFGVAALAIVARAGLSYPDLRERQRPTIAQWLDNVMMLLPPDSIVLHTGDHRVGAFLYARCALRERPDVVAIDPQLLLTDWYPVQTSARLGFDVVHGRRRPGAAAPSLASRALVEQLLATRRPVFVTDIFSPAIAQLPSYPIGPLIRIVPTREDLPTFDAVVAENEAAFARMQSEPTPPASDTWGALVMSDYARARAALAR